MLRKVALACGLAVALAACDWPMFRGGPAHTGTTSDTSISLANVASLAPAWTANIGLEGLSTPAVVNGVVYDGTSFSAPTPDGPAAFDAAGVQGCGGSPKVCTALWGSSTNTGNGQSAPAVGNGRVYVDGGSDARAYDAAGVTNCSGTPKRCAPLWRTQFAHTDSASSVGPTFANNRVYVGVTSGVLELDAETGAILREYLTSATATDPTIAGNVLYVGAGTNLDAFDLTGVTNCATFPNVCIPIWTGAGGGGRAPAVANGDVYVATASNGLRVYDAAGVTGCSGTPKVCAPLWTAPGASSLFGSPAVTSSAVYVDADDGHLQVYDASGTTNCSGAPVVCTPRWTAALGGGSFSVVAPAVVNGVVFAGSGSHLDAYDAAGNTNCTGVPKTCTAVWTATGLNLEGTGPVVSNGGVFIGGNGGLHAFRLP